MRSPVDVTFEHEGIRVSVPNGALLSNGRPTAEAVAFYSNLIAGIPALKQYVATRLLPLYNDVWYDEEIGDLDEEAFIRRLCKPSVQLYDDDVSLAVVYFKDGNIFGGHSIEVTIENGVPCDASLIG